ncbi:hypothetical protein AgCh_022996 [Apium graveolens]
MSDSSVYELGDIVWDEFAETEDHIVPYPKSANEHTSQINNIKKSGFDVVGVSNNSADRYAAYYVGQEKGERDISALDIANDAMLEDSQAHKSDSMFFGSKSDHIKAVTSFSSDNAGVSSHCLRSNNIDSLGESCPDYPSLSGSCTVVDSNSDFPSTRISETEKDLPRFIDTVHEDKDSSDLLYYNWPHIENFEDVDRMFRGCDPSFELGGAANEAVTEWFSASGAVEGSEDAPKSRFNFSCLDSNALKDLTEHLGPQNLKYDNPPINYSSSESASSSCKARSQLSTFDKPTSLSRFSLESSQISEENQKKQQKQKEGKRKDRHFEISSSLCHTDDLQKKGIHLPFEDSQHEIFSSNGIQKQQNLCYRSTDNANNNFHSLQSDYHQPSEQTTVDTMLSGMQSENSDQPSLFQKDSSHASSQMQRSRDFSFKENHIVPDDRQRNLHSHQGYQYPFDSELKDFDFPSNCNPASVQNGNWFKNYGDVEGVGTEIPADISSLNLQEISSENIKLNELSLEATSFRQLQQVMEQMDLKTKLCIRDSLYRLARSAQQRHHYANMAGGPGDVRNFMTVGTNECTGYMDMETDTNPVDRSIAHLLFHRPTDLPVMPCPTASSLDSHSIVSLHICC